VANVAFARRLKLSLILLVDVGYRAGLDSIEQPLEAVALFRPVFCQLTPTDPTRALRQPDAIERALPKARNSRSRRFEKYDGGSD
jgi:hypothetical protein